MLTCIDDRITLVLVPDTGAFKGAHRDRVFEVRDGDTVLGHKQQGGESLTAETLAGILPDVASALAQISALTSERDALKAQLAAAQPSVATPTSSLSVSPLQARKALKAAGLLAQVQAMVAAAPEDDDIRLAWDWALTWERDSPFVATLGAALGLTAEQIDALFTQAAAL